MSAEVWIARARGCFGGKSNQCGGVSSTFTFASSVGRLPTILVRDIREPMRAREDIVWRTRRWKREGEVVNKALGKENKT